MSVHADMHTVAVIGTGLIGASWASLFCAAGHHVRLFDQAPGKAAAARSLVAGNLATLREAGLAGDTPTKPEVCDTLEAAVAGAGYIQESVLETVEVKAEVARRIDAAMDPRAIVGSSSSGIPASRFTEGLANRTRFFVVHPANPPHLLPIVEIVPAPWSDPDLVMPLRSLMEALGQVPVTVRREIDGFVLNRLQGALLNEAWALLREGYASAPDIDAAVSHGLGPRWALMGPFATINLNAPGGIADYAERLEPLYRGIALSRRDPQPWGALTIAQAARELGEAGMDDRAALAAERDAWLLALRSLRALSDHS